MKKIIYTLALLSALAFATVSCTEENVKPHTGDSSGGSPSDPIK